MVVSVFFLRTRAPCFTVVGSKCLLLSPSIIALIQCQMPSCLFWHFNNVQGETESILKYRSRFEGLTLELARCKVVILSILLVVLFLWALHGCYVSIVDQFRLRFKPIEMATIDSIVSYVTHHDGFQVVDHSKKGKPGSFSGPRVPATAWVNTNTDCQDKV
jgi:hypothetical protein